MANFALAPDRTLGTLFRVLKLTPNGKGQTVRQSIILGSTQTVYYRMRARDTSQLTQPAYVYWNEPNAAGTTQAPAGVPLADVTELSSWTG